MDAFQSTGCLLHRRHGLLVHLRRLEGIHIHLQLELRSLQLLQFVLQHLLPLQRSKGGFMPIRVGTTQSYSESHCEAAILILRGLDRHTGLVGYRISLSLGQLLLDLLLRILLLLLNHLQLLTQADDRIPRYLLRILSSPE